VLPDSEPLPLVPLPPEPGLPVGDPELEPEPALEPEPVVEPEPEPELDPDPDPVLELAPELDPDPELPEPELDPDPPLELDALLDPELFTALGTRVVTPQPIIEMLMGSAKPRKNFREVRSKCSEKTPVEGPCFKSNSNSTKF
jgi:hypothetical protein